MAQPLEYASPARPRELHVEDDGDTLRLWVDVPPATIAKHTLGYRTVALLLLLGGVALAVLSYTCIGIGVGSIALAAAACALVGAGIVWPFIVFWNDMGIVVEIEASPREFAWLMRTPRGIRRSSCHPSRVRAVEIIEISDGHYVLGVRTSRWRSFLAFEGVSREALAASVQRLRAILDTAKSVR